MKLLYDTTKLLCHIIRATKCDVTIILLHITYITYFTYFTFFTFFSYIYYILYETILLSK